MKRMTLGRGMVAGINTGLVLSVCLSCAFGAFLENFETGSKTSYAAGDVACTEGSWHLDNFLLAHSNNDYTNGIQSLRGYGSISMNFDKTNGVDEVSLFHGMYKTDSANTNGVSWKLAVSRDGGYSWDAYVAPEQHMAADWQPVVFTNINLAGPIRIRIDVTGGKKTTRRINLDDISIIDYIAPAVSAKPPWMESFKTRVGTPASAQALVISGENLTSKATITAPPEFTVSRHSTSNYTDTLTLPQTNNTIAATTIFVRLNGSVVGAYTGDVVVASENALSAKSRVTGEVVDNQAPEINGVPAQTNLIVHQTLQLEILATDPDGSVTNLAASSTTIEDASAGLIWQAHEKTVSGSWSWTPQEPGSYDVTLTATDNEGQASTLTMALLVEPEWLIAILPGETIRENFDNLEGKFTTEAQLSTGWKVAKDSKLNIISSFADAGIRTERSAGNNLATTAYNGIYNFGAGDSGTASDRAIGFLSSGSATRSGNLMARLKNRSPDKITGFQVAFDIEKYRSGANPNGFMIAVYTSSNGVMWNARADSMRHAFAPDAATAGYAEAPGEVVHVTDVWADETLLPGESLYLAWIYGVTEGSTTTHAQALAIDNVIIKALAPRQTILMIR